MDCEVLLGLVGDEHVLEILIELHDGPVRGDLPALDHGIKVGVIPRQLLPATLAVDALNPRIPDVEYAELTRPPLQQGQGASRPAGAAIPGEGSAQRGMEVPANKARADPAVLQ
jgi:hypothetical protein